MFTVTGYCLIVNWFVSLSISLPLPLLGKDKRPRNYSFKAKCKELWKNHVRLKSLTNNHKP